MLAAFRDPVGEVVTQRREEVDVDDVINHEVAGPPERISLFAGESRVGHVLRGTRY